MSIEAMKLALEALEIAANGGGVNFYEYAKDLRQAIEQAEKQEPVAWMDSDWHYQLHKKGMVVAHKDKSDVLIGQPQPVYIHPKQWVGITDKEFEQMLTDAKFTRSDLLMIGACVDNICNMIEAKLKEKNNA